MKKKRREDLLLFRLLFGLLWALRLHLLRLLLLGLWRDLVRREGG
jgi:hypothetical protein